MSEYAEKDHDAAVLHAGIMLEHLAKAYLCSLHPALIVEGKDFPSLTIATETASKLIDSKPLRTKTIGIAEACARVGKFLAGFPKEPNAYLGQLYDGRNGVAHVASWDQTTITEVMGRAVKSTEPLLAALQVTHTDFWGEFADTATKMVAEHVTNVERAVQLLIDNARRRYEAQYGHLDSEQKLMLTVLEAWRPPDWDDDGGTVVTCPACAHQAFVQGNGELESADYDEGGPSYALDLVLEASYFYCPICRLQLLSTEAIDATGLETTIVLRSATEEEEFEYHYDTDLDVDAAREERAFGAD